MSDQLTLVWVGFCPPWWEEVVGCSEAGLTLYRAPGRMGTLAEQLAPVGGCDHGTTWHSDPLGFPQVNDSAEFLGERRGYAPFSPDENSLVLFDGRAMAGAGGCPEGSCPGLGEGGQHCAWHRPRGGASKSCLPLSVALPLCPGDEVYSTIRKQEYNGKIPRFRRIRGEIELYTSDTVMQSESGSHWAGLGWAGPTSVCECPGVLMFLGGLPEGLWGHRPSGKWELGAALRRES